MISVVMPVYNGEKYLKEAIESILNQTYTNFEFIILNDGSTDKTEEIILSYDDARIVYVKNEENLQIVKTLNKGIALAKGKYIARMDADDISLPKRFEKQIKIMERNTEIGVCGTWLKTFGEREEIWDIPVLHEEIIMNMLFESSLMHPTVFIRKSILLPLKQVYDQAFNKVEDYELWIRLSKKTRFENIPEVLLHYRISDIYHERKEYKQVQISLANNLRGTYLAMNNFKYDKNDLIVHNNLVSGNFDANDFIINAKKWLLKIMQNNRDNKFVSQQVCKQILTKKFYVVCSVMLKEKETYPIFVGFVKEIKYSSVKLRAKLFLKTIMIYLKEKI